jgi:dihydrofolate reductase
MGMSYLTHLPWPKLKREHKHFESTTQYVPADKVSQSSRPTMMNAVIFGYNTWDDEPTKFYPHRIIVVVTTDPAKVWKRMQSDKCEDRIHVARSIEEAVEILERTFAKSDPKRDRSLSNGCPEGDVRLGRIFIIGGAELCRSALKLPWVNRLLLTRVMGEFDADAFFPIPIDGNGNDEWFRKSDEEFREWAGNDTPIGVQLENGIEWEAFMFERRLKE